MTLKTNKSHSAKILAKYTDIKVYLPFLFFSFFLCLIAFAFERPRDIYSGMVAIFLTPGMLVTDYLAVGGLGSALFNAGFMALVSCLLFVKNKVPFTGIVVATIFTMAGFSLFGKNILNSLPIMLGVYLYTKFMGQEFKQHIIISLFATSLAPLVSSVALILPKINPPHFALWQSIPISIFIGIAIGFIMPTLATKFMGFHQGYNLYNAGFTAGLIGMMITGLLGYLGLEFRNNSIIYQGSSKHQIIILILIFLFFLGLSLALTFRLKDETKVDNETNECNETKYRIINSIKALFYNYSNLLCDSGRLISDFPTNYGFAATFLNMSLNGLLSLSLVLILGASLSGPVIAGIFCITGFSAFGKHPRNSLPIMLAVLFTNIITSQDLNSVLTISTLLFATTLAPISGKFGSIAGFAAGVFHMVLILKVSVLHEGANLYNNGFAGGFVAAFLSPLFEHFQHSRFSIINRIFKGSKHREFSPLIWQLDKNNFEEIEDLSQPALAVQTIKSLRNELEAREDYLADSSTEEAIILNRNKSVLGKKKLLSENKIPILSVTDTMDKNKRQSAQLDRKISSKSYNKTKNKFKKRQKSSNNLNSQLGGQNIANIVNELISYFQYHDIDKYDVSVSREVDRDTIKIVGDHEIAPAGLRQLSRNLNRGRDRSLEGYYEELLAIYDEGDEMPLLSVMIDGAKVHHNRGKLEIEVWRLNDNK